MPIQVRTDKKKSVACALWFVIQSHNKRHRMTDNLMIKS